MTSYNCFILTTSKSEKMVDSTMASSIRSEIRYFAKIYPAPDEKTIQIDTFKRCPVELFKAKRGYEQTELKLLTTVSEKPTANVQGNVKEAELKSLEWNENSPKNSEARSEEKSAELNKNYLDQLWTVPKLKKATNDQLWTVPKLKKASNDNLSRGTLNQVCKGIKNMFEEQV